MNVRLSRSCVALLSFAAFASGSRALAQAEIVPPSALPRVLSDQTFFYASLDAKKAIQGVRDLDLAKMLSDPEVVAFIEPLFAQFGVEKSDPIGSLLVHAPIESYLAGGVSVGFTGFDFAVGDPDKDLMHLRADHPLSMWLAHKLATVDLEVGTGKAATLPQWLFVDALLSIEPGDELRQMVRSFIENPPPECEITQTTIGGRPIVQLELAFPEGDKRTRVYASLDGPRWLLGGSRQSFEKALLGGRQDSLANSPTYQRMHLRVTAGDNQAAFVMVDVKRTLEIGSTVIPPILIEEAHILGIDCVRGFATGISFTEGGVRESMLLAFDGEPRGLFRLSQAFGGGFETLASSPANTAFFAGVRFDLQKLFRIADEELTRLFPNAPTLFADAVKEAQFGDISLVDDIVPAFGSEISLALGIPRTGLTPDGLFSLEIRDKARFQKLLDFAISQATEEGVTLRRIELAGAESAFSVSAPDAPFQPAFAVIGNHLIGSISSVALKSYLARSSKDGVTTIGQGDAGFAAIRRGFAGCPEQSAGFWMHADLSKVLPLVYDTATVAAPQMIDESGLPLDAANLPLSETLCRYVKSLAIAIHCDNDGVSIDAFSPFGLLFVGTTVGLAASSHAEEVEEFDMETEGDPDMPPDMGDGEDDAPSDDDGEEPMDDGTDGGGN